MKDTGVPDAIGDWKIEREIGRGGQAQVFKVRNTRERHSPARALKLSTTSDSKAVARFDREIQLLRAHKHIGLVSVIANGNEQGKPYYVMENATTTLSSVVASVEHTAGTRLVRESPGLLIEMLRQAFFAVGHLHTRGVLHRDIKPSNILLMLDPPEPLRALVSDLGIAAEASEQGSITSALELVGTPVFRAPEVNAGGPHTKQSDVYSLGKTMEAVFTASVPASYGPGQCHRRRTVGNDLWDVLDTVLARACALRPMDRFTDATQLAEALPEVVLAPAGSRQPSKANAVPSPSARALSVLTALLASCPFEDSRAEFERVKSTALVSDAGFTVGIKELQAIGFVVRADYENDNGFTVTALSLTDLAFEWAASHAEEIDPPRPSSAAIDIPF